MALAAEHEPAQDGDVEVPGDELAARRAVRSRPHNRFIPRNAVDADAEEASDAGPEEGDEGQKEQEDVRHSSWSKELELELEAGVGGWSRELE